ncbi:hypothetical protein [Actinoplanes couchii]|uniref:Uncharacterized protein n=1 Tax=Actinoplanes couchii TaxID=403638 RepID=A0ABQ3XLB4_9ACTN|nr:hypothetical protein [Actinoplanes couchii]MDR6318341.1 hypothetical protein [Actinoplanes couchii]GID59291.1 hypothetical protein Aco03nite_076950 [Actinoplanes couchii]
MRHLRQVPWSELDPAGREFDAARIPALVRRLRPADGDWYETMTDALVEALGPWAVGWAQTVEVKNRRAVWRADTSQRSPAAVAADVVAWHELLVEIATDARGRFADLPAPKGILAAEGPPAWRTLDRYLVYTTDNELTWADFDPTGRPFDVDSLPRVAYNALLPGGPGVYAGLAKHYGPWVSWWNTPGDEPFTVEGITAGVVRWHAWLVELARRFEEFQPLTEDDPDNWERAARYLIIAAGDYEDYALDWHHRVDRVFRWLLEVSEVPVGRHDLLIDFTLDSRLEYMGKPDPAYVARLAEDFALCVTDLPY